MLGEQRQRAEADQGENRGDGAVERVAAHHVAQLVGEQDPELVIVQQLERGRVEHDERLVDAVGAGVEERRLGDVELGHLGPVEGGADLDVQVPEPWGTAWARRGPRCPGRAAGCPRSPPRSAMILRTTSSKPGTARSAWSAARSAGCSQETAAISGKVRRGRGAGTDVIGRSGLGMLHLRRWHMFKVVRYQAARTVTGAIWSILRSASRAMRLVQVRDQVLRVLDPAAQPDQAVGEPHRLPHRRPAPRRGSSSPGGRSGSPPRRATRRGRRPGALDEPPGPRRHRPGRRRSSRRSRVICRQASSCCGCEAGPGSRPWGHPSVEPATRRSGGRWRRAAASGAAASWCPGARASSPSVPAPRPAAFWMKPSRSARSSRAGHQQAAHHVAVAVEVLGGGVEHDVGAVLERPLEERRGEGVVHHEEVAVRLGEVADGGEVDQVHHRVGGRLAVDHAGGGRERALHVGHVAHVHEGELEPEAPRRSAPSAAGCRRRRSRRRRRDRRLEAA